MLRLIIGFVLVLLLAFGAAWLADQPGQITLTWGGYEITTSVLAGAVVLALVVVLATLIWRSYHWLTGAPGAIGDWFRNRGRRKGFDALSHGLIAAGAGDADAAAREVAAAERHLRGAPLTLLLKAQTAQLKGETAKAQQTYKAMLEQPETETLGLRGLFLEARNEGDRAEARRLAERAVELKPSMGWASQALFELQAADEDWAGVRQTLDLRRRHRHIDKPEEARARAVIFTAEAQAADGAADNSSRDDEALDAALAAHKLAPDLVPATAIAARILAEKGETGRSSKLVEKTWRLSPHPDLATIFAHARPGDSTQDRLRRARQLAGKTTDGPEGHIAVARAAIEAREWLAAREAIKPLTDDQPTRRVCMLMAEIENGEHGNRGRVREWLARAMSAPRDPAWTAGSHVSDHWRPISPETGAFDVYEWRVPVQGSLPAAGQTIEDLATGDEQGSTALVVDLANAPPGQNNTPETAALETIEASSADQPASEKAGAASSQSQSRSDSSEKDDESNEPEILIAPIPDDPGVSGDDYDDTDPRPKSF